MESNFGESGHQVRLATASAQGHAVDTLAVARPSWRREPEIDDTRKKELTAYRTIVPDIERGIYPFSGVHLTRADIEWLLATHESGGMIGPVDWSDKSQRGRVGLDLRGSHAEGVDLSGMPLARLRGGVPREDWDKLTADQRDATRMYLERVNLIEAHLEGANLIGAQMQRATLIDAHLELADLRSSELQKGFLREAHLEGAHLRGVYFDVATNLSGIHLASREYGTAFLGEVRWGDVNLTTIDWSQIRQIGEEREARRQQSPSRSARLAKYEDAVRAYRQLASILRTQGLTEESDSFHYRAQLLQQQVLRRKRKFGAYFFSRFIDGLAGYGYKPVRGLIAYVLVILGFALAFGLATHGLLTFGLPPSSIHPLQWYEALVLSISSFHGRGFFQPVQSLGDPVAIIAAAEAIIGLLIEISFIATFTQRFFAR